MNRLENKVAIVTGGTSGMGKATCKLFAEEGAKVVVAGRRQEQGDAVVAEIREKGGEATFVKTDLSKPEDLENLVARTVETYGGIDVLINDAAFYSTKPMADLPLDEWNYSWAVNVTAPFYLSKIAIPYMQKRGAGRIVNISSIAGAQSKYGCAAYTSTKHAVLGLTKAIAREYGPTIRANCIMPGAVMTPMLEPATKTPEGQASIKAMVADSNVKRVGQPEEIAQVCLFFATDESSFVAGQCVRVDGGLDL